MKTPSDQQHAYISRMHSNGDTVWTRTLASFERSKFSTVIVNDGAIYCAGWAIPSRSDSIYNGLVSKLDLNGDVLWTRLYKNGDNELFTDVATNASHNIIVVGKTFAASKESNGYALCIDTTGDVLWDREFAIEGSDWIAAIESTADEDFMLAGNQDLNHSGGDGNVLLMKLSVASKDTLWMHLVRGYGAQNWQCTNLVRSDDHFMLVGDIGRGAPGGADVALFNVDASGATVWSRSMNQEWPNSASQIVTTRDGGYAISGYRSFQGGNIDMYLVKTRAD